MEQNAGEGWWGTEQYSSYYSGVNNPFSWIGIHPLRTNPENAEQFPGDHAGKLETSEAMVICPEYVDMDRYDDSLWYARSARAASAEYGEAALNAWSQDVEAVLFGNKY